MPRPLKGRNVCCLPTNDSFGPLENKNQNCKVIMGVDEYEAIRLIDYEGLSQEDCAKQMNVARTTVQGIYCEARKKIADALVNGKFLFIEGGEYKICNNRHRNCGRKHCKMNERDGDII